MSSTITKQKNFVSAIIYVHNNSTALYNFFPVIYKAFDMNFENYEIICVDDATEDNALEVIADFSLKYPSVLISIIHMGIYQGVELAMSAGIDSTIGDFIYQFDDLNVSYSEKLIIEMYNKALEGNDIVAVAPEKVYGIRAKIFYRIFNLHRIGKNRITQDVCHIMSRRAVNRIQMLNTSIPYRKAIYSNCGLKCEYIIIDRSLIRQRSANKIQRHFQYDMAFEALVMFTDAVQKMSSYITILFLLFSVSIGAYAILVYLGQNKPVEGWTFIILFLSIAFVGVFLLLTIIFRYLSILLNLVFRRQKYLIDSIEKINNR